ncbi:MAG: CHAT domain-containing protein [Desulfobacterales bacterium]|nr:CHAT domain-containing protein [Desulfobacterales bacterium]
MLLPTGIKQVRVPVDSENLVKSSGISKAKALQNAQKKLIPKQRYRHPAYWVPFLLIGNWL